MNVLDRICADKRDHVHAVAQSVPLAALQEKVNYVTPPRPFLGQLQKFANEGKPALIAEVKKASPSKGLIRQDFDPAAIARIYEDSGAACISVLTDIPYFQGHDDYLVAVREEVSLPVLRKDFMLEPYQIYESRVLGADCVLLIMAALSDQQAAELYDCATQLGMATLFEVHNKEELDRALPLKPQLLGVNNRDLKTLEVDLQNGLDLIDDIPTDVFAVAESGIGTHDNLQSFLHIGYKGFLVGESLMRQDDIGAAVRKLLNTL